MENEKYIPSFGENEELEFDVCVHGGKLRPINVTGPGGAPLKGFVRKQMRATNEKGPFQWERTIPLKGIFFRDQPLKEAKKQKTEKQKTELLKILLTPFSGIHAFIHRVKKDW